MNGSTAALLADLQNVSIAYGQGAGLAVQHATVSVGPGESVGLVGESGSGKSTLARTLLGPLPGGGHVVTGTVSFGDLDLAKATRRELVSLRGAGVGIVVQDPMSALHPLFRVGSQVAEAVRAHAPVGRAEAQARGIVLLSQVKIPDPEQRSRSYPFEFSGGQLQRIVIATALASSPALIIADEPTTALDATVQQEILDEIDNQCRARGAALLLITHDISVVIERTERVVVMYAGEIVEEGPTQQVVDSPQHPYSSLLIRCAPTLDSEPRVPLATIDGTTPPPDVQVPGCRFSTRCPWARDRCREEHPALTVGADGSKVRCHFPGIAGTVAPSSASAPAFSLAQQTHEADVLLSCDTVTLTHLGPRDRTGARAAIHALRGASVEVRRGETLGILGESGSGKSTLCRIITGLEKPMSGVVAYDGRAVDDWIERDEREFRRRVQIVFQDPLASLDPRMAVWKIVAEPLATLLGVKRRDRRERVDAMLARVGLAPELGQRRLSQLSGGQRQRVGIARALIVEPELLVLDEPVSALDASVQAQILNLILGLQEQLGLTCVFVAHDVTVVRHVSHRIALMHRGVVVECGQSEEVVARPTHPYTASLVASVPGSRFRDQTEEVEDVEGSGRDNQG